MLNYNRWECYTVGSALMMIFLLVAHLATQSEATTRPRDDTSVANPEVEQSASATRSDVAAALNAEQDIRKLLDRFFLLATENKWDELAILYTDDCKMFTDGATVFDKRKYMELLSGDKLEVKEWKLNDLKIHVATDQKLAWCRYGGYFDHGDFKVESIETLIFKYQKSWKIAHAHASIKMITDETQGDKKDGH